MRTILHIDFNSYFASVEQQANPHLRGQPVGVAGGDRMKRTVLGAASQEAKRFGVKTGMQIWQAKKLCPNLILVQGDSDKYLECTKRFLAILKDYSPYLEVFSIDEAFLELSIARGPATEDNSQLLSQFPLEIPSSLVPSSVSPLTISLDIKRRIKKELGEYITCSIGISYNKLMAKLAGSLYKPDGLVVIADEQAAQFILDKVELDKVCGIGPRIKHRLFNMGVTNFKQLRAVPKQSLVSSFKSYGQVLYNMARGLDESPVVPFYEKEEVKSIGHRHTIDHDTADSVEIKQILYKLTELVARRLRAKKLVGKTVHCWYRQALHLEGAELIHPPGGLASHLSFFGNGMQTTIAYTNDGLEIFKAAWKIFYQMWNKEKIRMIGVSITNLKSITPQNLTFLDNILRQEKIIKAIDTINNHYGEFTLSRAILLGSEKIRRKANPYLADRRFKL